MWSYIILVLELDLIYTLININGVANKKGGDVKKNSSTQLRTLHQVPIPPESHLEAKRYSADNGITLNDFYDNSVRWFLKASLTNPKLYYLTSPKTKSKYTSLWLSDISSTNVKARADEDEVSINRVIYSAIIHFLIHKKYL